MRRGWIIPALIGAIVSGAAAAERTLPQRAGDVAAELAAACPAAGYNQEVAFSACAKALRSMALPLEAEVAWGGDQADKPIRKKTLTHLSGKTFQTMYLPLFAFTGRWSLDEDKRSHTTIVRLEAYFRNALPAGDFPYPFWHAADKWAAYEAANEIRLYLNGAGRAFIITRGAAGSNDRRGAYDHVQTPAFSGKWQWQDAAGTLQPSASLFATRYQPANPYLPDLDEAYRAFALRMRDQSCLNCHTPLNTAEADRLVLLQTPMHAAGEIDNVIKAVNGKEMPQDDIGLPKDIPAADRAAILGAAVAFRDELRLADGWEATHGQ